ncbi:MAG TPA: DEAD/DEAH box helicase family protein, partial [Rubrivivax sp.]|nr:DEAD/DEAH box helicase family protein [Rubrivivax sp.]
LDVVHWQAVADPVFRECIERDRRRFWAHAAPASAARVGTLELKRFQSDAIDSLSQYIDELLRRRAVSEQALLALRAMEGVDEERRAASDFPRKAWEALRAAGRLPPRCAAQPHSSRWDGAGRAIPNVCLKVPTGGGKTLLGAAGIARATGHYLRRHTGLVLWIVPNEAIYRQTLKALRDRDHAYRQLLNVAGAGRVKVLEKDSPLTRLDTDSHLCVMLLMLQSAARQSKETLKFFRDRGNVLGFLPAEDDIDAHWALLQAVPNLDAYAPWGASAAEARATRGSIVKSSLGNVMRLLQPVVVMDEGHHAYTETALGTIDGFNPAFMLELSATPRLKSERGSGSNILVDVRGSDLDEAEMIKLPIEVDVRGWADWQSCLGAAVHKLDALQADADALRAQTARYIRPMLLVQVERTGAEQRLAGYIHAEDARDYLKQLGLADDQIAIKTSEKNDLAAPENIDLLAPSCRVRAIVTKQALQEGWDCPFAYVLCSLAAGRNLRAMTQLVGRVLRLPHVAKTGRAALDACYVLCHDAETGAVVRAVKQSLEQEGMGDLGVSVSGDGGRSDDAVRRVQLRRRADFQRLRLFVPRVAWVDSEDGPDGTRRELDYDSDVLGQISWEQLDASAFAADWAPDTTATATGQFAIGLDILERNEVARLGDAAAAPQLDRARLVRALLDLAPNPWWAWTWVDATLHRLRARGLAEHAIARSTASLIERLRIDVEAARDVLAQAVFERLLHDGRIEFRLRADRLDYELPAAGEITLASEPTALTRRSDGQPVGKSLLEPALLTPDLNEFEIRVAGWLDQQAAVQWWHRNVAKSQAGLQGWKRHKVYPDFVFALHGGDARRIVLLETKGLHLQGQDTRYKQELMARLTQAFGDERGTRIGSLELQTAQRETVICDLVFDEAWQGALAHRFFSPS